VEEKRSAERADKGAGGRTGSGKQTADDSVVFRDAAIRLVCRAARIIRNLN
jgi:hypothetical protein